MLSHRCNKFLSLLCPSHDFSRKILFMLHFYVHLLNIYKLRKLYFILYFLQAKGLLSEYQPKYNSARAVYREKKKYIDEIDWNMLAIPPAGSCKVFFEIIMSCKKTFYYTF